MAKYELVKSDFLVVETPRGTVKVYRIRALSAFGNVKKGELGGYVQEPANLDQKGTAWVSGNARVSEDARVFGNAQVRGDAQVYGTARVYENAQVSGGAQVYGDAQVSGNAGVSGNAWVFGNARVRGTAQVYGNARFYGDAQTSGDARVSGNAQVYGTAWVNEDAWVSGNAQVYENARVCGNAWVHGDAQITRPILQLSGCKLTANENGQGVIRFGCLVDTIEGWLASWDVMGKERGYSPAEIAICKMFIDQVALMQKECPLPTKEH